MSGCEYRLLTRPSKNKMDAEKEVQSCNKEAGAEECVDRSIRISVVIPAYNIGKYIRRALDSVLGQSRGADEIIVVDDGSTDGTGEVVKKYGSAVRYIYQDNAGASVARNTGIRAARFEWIAFLDGDDEWVGDYLDRQRGLLSRNRELVWTTANFYRCLCDENRRGPSVDPGQVAKVLAGKEYFDDYFGLSTPQGFTCTDTMVVRKDVLEKAGMFREGQLIANDLDMWWRIAYRWSKIGYISEPMAIYHMIIPQSISQKYKQMEILRELIRRHLRLAAEYGRLDVFGARMERVVRSWVRSLLFENRPGEIRELMAEFDELLSRRFKRIIGLLLISPGLTAGCCHAISRVVRALGLRRDILRRPGKPGKNKSIGLIV